MHTESVQKVGYTIKNSEWNVQVLCFCVEGMHLCEEKTHNTLSDGSNLL